MYLFIPPIGLFASLKGPLCVIPGACYTVTSLVTYLADITWIPVLRSAPSLFDESPTTFHQVQEIGSFLV
jgi:hypothetical protein